MTLMSDEELDILNLELGSRATASMVSENTRMVFAKNYVRNLMHEACQINYLIGSLCLCTADDGTLDEGSVYELTVVNPSSGVATVKMILDADGKAPADKEKYRRWTTDISALIFLEEEETSSQSSAVHDGVDDG